MFKRFFLKPREITKETEPEAEQTTKVDEDVTVLTSPDRSSVADITEMINTHILCFETDPHDVHIFEQMLGNVYKLSFAHTESEFLAMYSANEYQFILLSRHSSRSQPSLGNEQSQYSCLPARRSKDHRDSRDSDKRRCSQELIIKLVSEIRMKYKRHELPIMVVTTSDDIWTLGEDINDCIMRPINKSELLYRINLHSSICQAVKLEIEQNKKLVLLHNLLPKHIVKRLVANPNTLIADYHQSVTILFADMVGFTAITSEYPMETIVNFLDTLYRKFDDLTEKHKVWKNEVVGDEYMVVCGHTQYIDSVLCVSRIISLGKDMLKMVKDVDCGIHHDINIRIGVHTGPVYSGVIGRIRPRYCFIGDTINVASRMESTGIPNAIHVSSATYENMESHIQETFFKRHPVHVKGKGIMQTYLYTENPECCNVHSENAIYYLSLSDNVVTNSDARIHSSN